MTPRVLPLALVVAAVLADASGRHELAFYVLVAAVPAAAASALTLFGELVDLPGGARGVSRARLEAFLAALGLVCVVVAAAARGQAVGAIPALAGLAALLALCVYGMQSVAALATRR